MLKRHRLFKNKKYRYKRKDTFLKRGSSYKGLAVILKHWDLTDYGVLTNLEVIKHWFDQINFHVKNACK